MADLETPDQAVSDPGLPSDEEQEGDEGLDAVQLRMADMISTGATIEETAKAIGRSTRTVRRWKKDKAIAAVIKARASEAVAMGRAVLSSGMYRASRALVAMADGTAEASAPRVSAARAVVEVTAKLVELEGVQEQLDEIKQQLAALPGGQREFQS